MKASRLFTLIAVAVLLLVNALLPTSTAKVAQAAAACTTSNNSTNTYSVTVCLTAPAGGSVLSGTVPVTASVTAKAIVSGTILPHISKLIFTLNGNYLLTDYRAPYAFYLPTVYFVDGAYTLGFSATMTDKFVTSPVTVSVTFKNGRTSPPVNTRKFTPALGTTPASGSPFRIVVVGDAASGTPASMAVSNLAVKLAPNMVLYLGNVFDKGSQTEFYNWYGSATTGLGRLKTITNPTLGNHDYGLSANAAAYRYYWNNPPDYYSFNVAGWHIISLNSNLGKMGSAAATAQMNWLKTDLATHASACKIVMYNSPVYNIGPTGVATNMTPYWSLLAQYKTTLVLNGHDHSYQRWKPMNGLGQLSSNGVTEMIIGAGGQSVSTIAKTDTRVAYSNSTNPGSIGALTMLLSPTTITTYYRNTSTTLLDSSFISCKK